ncbi:MAG: hemerythrin domain-containing protein [Candidatus Bathyarchaeota archaeon]|nr:hemerythrin domain-containing protein [Candidatus Bathyarchaeota archaeon]
MPVDMLVIEHKLILQAVEKIKKEIGQIEAAKAANPNYLATAVDFFRTYADRFHHGKEEGILFRALSQRNLNETDQKVMMELMIEHGVARRTVTALDNAKGEYIEGKQEALTHILDLLNTLVKLYPAHIEKEDAHFFYPSMAYFTEKEQNEMQTSFITFNQNFTDKKYQQVIDQLQ